MDTKSQTFLKISIYSHIQVLNNIRMEKNYDRIIMFLVKLTLKIVMIKQVNYIHYLKG